MDRIIGVCSICDGSVVVPEYWLGIYPPVPRCSKCGATEQSRLPVIPMTSRMPQRRYRPLDEYSPGGYYYGSTIGDIT